MPNSLQFRAGRLAWLLASGFALTVTWVFAQSNPATSVAPISAKPSASADRKRSNFSANTSNVMMTPERQAAALKFAELHHPELHQLLVGLKNAHRPEYAKAIRQLYNDSERLARGKERTPSRYELGLREWQLDSRLRLLVARMTMSSEDPELNAQLQDLLKKRVEARLALLKLDRERQAARLAKLDEHIQEIEADRESALQKDLQRIQKSLGVSKRTITRPVNSREKPVDAKRQ